MGLNMKLKLYSDKKSRIVSINFFLIFSILLLAFIPFGNSEEPCETCGESSNETTSLNANWVSPTYSSDVFEVVEYNNGTQEKVNFSDVVWSEIDKAGLWVGDDKKIISGFDKTHGQILMYNEKYDKPPILMFVRTNVIKNTNIYTEWITREVTTKPYFTRNESDGYVEEELGYNYDIPILSYNFPVSIGVKANNRKETMKIPINLTTPIDLDNISMEYIIAINPAYTEQAKKLKYVMLVNAVGFNETTNETIYENEKYELNKLIDKSGELSNITKTFFFLTENNKTISWIDFEKEFDLAESVEWKIKQVTLPNGNTTYVLALNFWFGSLDSGETLSLNADWTSPSSVSNSQYDYFSGCTESSLDNEDQAIDGDTGTSASTSSQGSSCSDSYMTFDMGSASLISGGKTLARLSSAKTVTISTSDSPTSGFSNLCTYEIATSNSWVSCTGTEVTARYIRITIPPVNLGMLYIVEFEASVASAGSANGVACSVDGDCTSTNCVTAINNASKFCADATDECSRSGYATGYDTAQTYDAGTTTYICKGDNLGGSACADAGTQNCDEYVEYYCNSGTWTSGSSDEEDLGCATCKWCNGTSANSEGDLGCVNADAGTDVGSDCDGNCNGAGACSNYSLSIIQPTTATPLSVTGGDNISINFTFQENDVNLTNGVTMENITIGGSDCPVVSNLVSCSPDCDTHPQTEGGTIDMSTSEITKIVNLDNTYDLSKAFIVSRRGGGHTSTTYPDETTTTTRFINTTAIQADRYDHNSHIGETSYYIVQSDNIEVINFTNSWASGDEDDDVTLTSALPDNYNDKCFVELYRNTKCNGAVNHFADAEILANITSTTTVKLKRDTESAGTACVAETVGYVVCFLDETNVTTGYISTTIGTTATTEAISEVNDSNSFLSFNYMVDNDGLAQVAVRGWFSSSTQLSFKRQTATGTVSLRYYVIEFEEGRGSLVQKGYSDSTVATDWDKEITCTEADLSKTFSWTSNDCTGAGTAFPRPFWREYFINSTTLHFSRTYNGQTSDHNWQVITLPSTTSYDTGETTGGYEFGYISDVGWQVNCTVPTNGFSGLEDLFLNATYSGITRNDTQTNAINYAGVADITPPTYSLNSTNSTVAETDILHSLNWQDTAGLSGYTFQFCNGTWDGSNCLTKTNIELEDNFNDNSLNTTILVESTNGGSLVTEVTGILNVTSTAGVSGYVRSVDTFIPQNKDFVVKVTKHCTNAGFKLCPTDAVNHQWDVYLQSNWYNFQLDASDTISPNVKDGGSSAQVGGNCDVKVPYWLRMHVTDTTIYFQYVNDTETKPTEGDWVTCSSETWDMGTGITQPQYVYMTAYDTPSSGMAYYDNLDVTNTTIPNNGWVNDSWTAMTSTADWSNVTKSISSEIGLNYSWRVHANDTSDNWNNSDIFSYVSTSSIPENTCNPTSPLSADYVFDCNDNCTQDATLNANGHAITWNGVGNYYVESDIENVKDIIVAYTCNFIKGSGDIIGMYN